MKSEDVLVLLKIMAIGSNDWNPYVLSMELGHSPYEIESSIKRIREAGLLTTFNRPCQEHLANFILIELPKLFPATPGRICRGMLTGAKPNAYRDPDLPYSSVWAWPKDDGLDWGLEIKPLSPHCCFAALNDSKLRKILAVTETLRVSGPEAKEWANSNFRQIGLF